MEKFKVGDRVVYTYKKHCGGLVGRKATIICYIHDNIINVKWDKYENPVKGCYCENWSDSRFSLEFQVDERE